MNDNIKVLVVEDDILTAMMLCEVVNALHCRAFPYATNGEDALTRMDAEKPDLVFLDVTLGGEMDGIETARAIRLRSQVPIVFMTGYERDELARDTSDIPFTSYIIKPVMIEEIKTLIESIMIPR